METTVEMIVEDTVKDTAKPTVSVISVCRSITMRGAVHKD